jgi:hypothetical protein
LVLEESCPQCNPLAPPLWLLPFPVLGVGLLSYWLGVWLTPLRFCSLYALFFLMLYSYFFHWHHRVMVRRKSSLCSSTPLPLWRRSFGGAFVEMLLFRRIGVVPLISALAVKLLILWWVDVLPYIILPLLRTPASFYIYLRTLVMYEESLGEQSDYRDIASFGEASKVFGLLLPGSNREQSVVHCFCDGPCSWCRMRGPLKL